MTVVTPSIRASGNSFANLQIGGLIDHLERLLTANSTATAAPTSAPTASATGGGATGGLLAAGNYLIVFTELNGFGETTASPESTSLTVGSTNIPRVTFPTLKTGNVSRNLYITAAGGTTGTEVLYASNITTTTYDMAVAAPASTVAPPTASTTGVTQYQIDAARRLAASSFAREPQNLVASFLRGEPIALADAQQRILDFGVAFHLLATALDEIAVLMAANTGTLSTTTRPTGIPATVRTFP